MVQYNSSAISGVLVYVGRESRTSGTRGRSTTIQRVQQHTLILWKESQKPMRTCLPKQARSESQQQSASGVVWLSGCVSWESTRERKTKLKQTHTHSLLIPRAVATTRALRKSKSGMPTTLELCERFLLATAEGCAVRVWRVWFETQQATETFEIWRESHGGDANNTFGVL